MKKTLGDSRIGRIALLLFLIITATSVASAQGARKKSSKIAAPSSSNTAIQPQLLNADTNPTLRFPVARMSLSVNSISYGWLDISRGRIQYQLQQPPNKLEDGFSVAKGEIQDLKLDDRYNMLKFRAGDKKHTVFYDPQESWGSIRGGREYLDALGEGASGTQAIYKTMLDFDAMLALVKSTATPPAPVIATPSAPASPPSTPVAPPAPPTIMVSSPSGAATNQTVEFNESPLVIRGVAMDNTGIPVVSINGTPANMRPQNPQAAEFWSDPLPLQPGANPIQITASNSAHAEAKVAFNVHYAPKAAPVNPRALAKAEIISLLQGAVPASSVVGIVKDRGIKFNPTAQDLNDIRAAGGSDELIQAIQQAASPK